MSEKESEIDNTGNLVGGLITWILVAIILMIVTSSGASWGAWALGGWGTLLVLDILQAQLRKKKVYVRLLSDLWQLPF